MVNLTTAVVELLDFVPIDNHRCYEARITTKTPWFGDGCVILFDSCIILSNILVGRYLLDFFC